MATPIEWGIGALIAGGAAAAAGLSAVAATGSLAHQVNESSHKRKEKERKDQRKQQSPYPIRQTVRIENRFTTTNGGSVARRPDGTIVASGRQAGDSTSGCFVYTKTSDFGYGQPPMPHNNWPTGWSYQPTGTYHPEIPIGSRYLPSSESSWRAVEAPAYSDSPPSYTSSAEKSKINFWKY